MKMPIFFCVIKSMDLLSGHDINCELIDMKGNGFLPNTFKIETRLLGSEKCYVLSFKELFLYWNIARITNPLEI